jgi:uncharacterized protein with NAD-binding domain and iron-sulfur cluster
MQAQLIQTYQQLMTELHNLPNEIATVQTDLNAAKMQLSASEKTLADIEAQTALNVEGKNAEERKARLAQTLKLDAVYVRWSKAADIERADVANLTNNYDLLVRQFAAVGYAAKLHAGLLTYLAESGAISSVGDINFGMGKPQGSNGHMTAADAADLGL